LYAIFYIRRNISIYGFGSYIAIMLYSVFVDFENIVSLLTAKKYYSYVRFK